MSNILIVDDDKSTLQQIEILVTSFGYTPVPTVYSTHIFDILENEHIDLILMDIHMPDVDGLNLLQQLKLHKLYNMVPVIMLTSDTDDNLLEECFKNGAMDFINKPVKEVVLRARIQSALSIRNYIYKLRNVNEQMGEFVGIVSHDLRSPIVSFTSFCKLLTEAPDEIATFIPEMEKTSKRALRMVNDLLDLMAMKCGKISMDMAPADFSIIAYDAINTLKFQADKKKVSLVNNVGRFPTVNADHNRIYQVLNNLLTNAIKFTHSSGNVTIDAMSTDNGLKIEVTDTGVGINPEKIPELFQKHKRVSTYGTDGEKGTGFGLPLAQEIVQAHGSIIEVESELNRGSTFFFFLPWYKYKT